MPRKKKVSFRRSQIILIALICLALIFIAFQRLGFIGIYFDRIMNLLFGERRDLVYFGLGSYAIYRIFSRKQILLTIKYSMMGILITVLIILTSTYISYEISDVGFEVFRAWTEQINFIFFDKWPAHGGVFGVALYALFTTLFDRLGTLFVLIIGYLALIVMNVDFTWLKTKVKTNKMNRDKKEINYIDEPQVSTSRTVFLTSDDSKTQTKTKVQEPEIKTKSAAIVHVGSGDYTIPNLSLLDEVAVKSKSNANSIAASQKGRKLIEILNEFGVTASLVGTHIGPAVTKFEVRPESNVKISKIASLQDNIKMELSAKELRLEAPIPGRNAVGVEIPNIEMVPVRMIELMKDVPSDKLSKKLLFPLGKDLMGKSVFTELDKMPHLLIAGATGSGKSVCVNSIIINYLLRTTPDELKMVLIDPKKVEFTPYHKIPHLISPVISDAAEAAKALKVIVSMMENRYEVFSNIGVRNIQSYNELLAKKTDPSLNPMPWIVVIIDELADLMIVAGKDVEGSIQRITQLARAAGIHLIVATQRPSTDVITGIIKANIPSRIAFAVSSGIDSRVILDGVGAERLLGYGDMLFFPVGEPAPLRVQGVYINDEEIRRITDFVSKQQKPQFDDAFLNLSDPEASQSGQLAFDDPIFEEVKQYVIETQRASTSNIQRRFGLGYNRAARLIDMLEQQGIVGPAQGSKPRDVYSHKG